MTDKGFIEQAPRRFKTVVAKFTLRHKCALATFRQIPY